MRAAILFATLLWISCSEKPADRFTYVFGKKQHILETGKGEPVVLFISGFGDRVSSWMSVQEHVSIKVYLRQAERHRCGLTYF